MQTHGTQDNGEVNFKRYVFVPHKNAKYRIILITITYFNFPFACTLLNERSRVVENCFKHNMQYN